jgi:hypothetical protein
MNRQKLIPAPANENLSAEAASYSVRIPGGGSMSVCLQTISEDEVPLYHELQILVDREAITLKKLVDTMRVRVAYCCISEYMKEAGVKSHLEVVMDIRRILKNAGLQDENLRTTLPEIRKTEPPEPEQ